MGQQNRACVCLYSASLNENRERVKVGGGLGLYGEYGDRSVWGRARRLEGLLDAGCWRGGGGGGGCTGAGAGGVGVWMNGRAGGCGVR
jgi:hypothetical protein